MSSNVGWVLIFYPYSSLFSLPFVQDEIDSLLSQRQESEFEASRRIKTEFLVQLDGCTTTGKERVLVVGATNRPQELVRNGTITPSRNFYEMQHLDAYIRSSSLCIDALTLFLSVSSQDEAARRRLVKKLYIPLPDAASRMQLLRTTMSKPGVDHRLTDAEFSDIVERSDGYSGSDMSALITEAAMGPIRHLSSMMEDESDISRISATQVRPIALCDFDVAFKSIRPSVNQKDLEAYEAWNVRNKTRSQSEAW